MIVIIGAFIGFFSVFFGYHIEHNLREFVSEEQYRQLMTGIRYNQLNSIIICSIGLAVFSESELLKSRLLQIAGYFFIIGTLLFCSGIYVSISFDIPQVVYLTPVGGLTIMASWILLFVFGIVASIKKSRRPTKSPNP
jgi:uncharacterized membrane protein YgdD (TMEM256/DUF423 family)